MSFFQSAEIVRASGDHHDNNWLAGGDDGIKQLLLHAGQIKTVGIRAFTDRARLEQAGQIADADHGDVG